MHNVLIFFLVKPPLSVCEHRSCYSRLPAWLHTGSVQRDTLARKRQAPLCEWINRRAKRFNCRYHFRADSVAWNPHKMMGTPLQCCAFLTKETVSKPNASSPLNRQCLPRPADRRLPLHHQPGTCLHIICSALSFMPPQSTSSHHIPHLLHT